MSVPLRDRILIFVASMKSSERQGEQKMPRRPADAMDHLTVRRYTGREIEELVPAVAQLRTTVFREYPYLYDGGIDEEEEYLATYVESSESICVIVSDGGEIVGASTGLPLPDADELFRRPFPAAGIDPASVFYFGESVLQKEYRGRGIGHRFFDEREAYAKEFGRFELTAFCAVQRSPDHPLRPEAYRPLDPFWLRRGYVKRPDIRTTYIWKDVDEETESAKNMVFWMKPMD